MTNLKNISNKYSDPISPQNIVKVLATNRAAAKFNPDTLTNL